MARKLQVFGVVALMALMIASVAHAQQGQGRGGRGGGRFGGGTDLFRVAANEAVQTEVGIATDQADKIRELSRAFRTAQREQRQDRGGFQDLSREERREVIAEIQKAREKLLAEYEPKLAEVVSKEQLARLKEIRVQAAGLADQAVRKELGVTEQQLGEFAEIQREYRGKTRELRQGGGGGGGNREAMAKLREEQQEANIKVLTDDQKTKFVAMKGKPFDVSQLRRGGRGGGQRRRRQ